MKTVLRRRRRDTLRASPGRLVLAHGQAARVRVPARWPCVSRRALRGGRVLMWVLTRMAWPRHLRGGAPALIPAVLIFAYLAIVLYIGIFAFRRSTPTDHEAEDYFSPGARSGRWCLLALRHKHDGVHDPRLCRPRLRERRRDVRTDGLFVGLRHPADAVLHRHAVWALGRRHGSSRRCRCSATGGRRAHRHRHLRRPGGAARALPSG